MFLSSRNRVTDRPARDDDVLIRHLCIPHPTRANIVPIIIVVLAYPAGCGGSGVDVHPDVMVDARNPNGHEGGRGGATKQ